MWTTEHSHEEFVRSFHAEVLADYERSGVNPTDWRAGGRSSKAFPNKEDETWWRAHGPSMVQSYADWRENTPDLSLWVTPAGEPAIELELHPVIGGVPVKMFLDRVFQYPDGTLLIVDLKTGSRAPDADLQLGFYRVGLQKVLGVNADLGAYWMARTGGLTPVADISRFNEHLIGGMLRDFNTAVENEVFIPHLSSKCNTCGVNRACYAFGGVEAQHSDPLHPEFNLRGTNV
jgi:hypothetical protein